MTAEQLMVAHVDRDWEVHDGHGEIVGVFGTRLGAVRFAECFTGDVIVLSDAADRGAIAQITPTRGSGEVRGEHGLELVRQVGETCTTLVLDGDIDVRSAPLVQQAVAAAFRDGAGDVVLDLRHVAFVDSSGLGVLIACHKRARHESCRLVLRAPSPRVARLLAVTTLDRVLSVEPESDVT